MSYRIHSADRHAIVLQLADLLRHIPCDEFSGLLADAELMFLIREPGNKEPGAKPARPYLFENNLIASANEYIANGNPLNAYMHCLKEGNRRIYMHPVNDAERVMSEKIRQMIVKIADALINSDPLSKNIEDFMGDGWITITSSYDCLVMLGKDVPPELIGQLRSLIVECQKFANENGEILSLEHTFKNRFG